MKNESLGERLVRLRKTKNLTAKEMAQMIEVPESTYREWEYGRGLKLPPLKKISQVLAISVTELVTGEQLASQKFLDELIEIETKVAQLKANVASLI